MDKKGKDFKIKRSWLFETKQNFAKRWDIEIEDNHFYERCISIISKVINKGNNFEELLYRTHLIIGKIYTQKHITPSIQNILSFKGEEFNFGATELYYTLKELSNDDCLYKFLEAIEFIINFYEQSKNNEIIEEFNDTAYLSNKPIRLYYDTDYKFYHSDVEIFDKKLINDVLDFLKDYPKAHKELSEALKMFINKKSYRDVVDKTRLALELFLKQLLNNKKSLENQKDILNKYLDNNIHKQIKSMFINILDLYEKLNNDNAKHDSNEFLEYEVEFLFYLVGNFIRLFMQIKPKSIIKN